MLQLYTLSLRMFNRQDAIIVFLYNIVYRSFICIFFIDSGLRFSFVYITSKKILPKFNISAFN